MNTSITINSTFFKYFSKKMLSLLLLGFSSGLPLALTASLLQAWFKVSGVNVVSIGLLSLIGQPYVYRFLWSPLLDRYRSPFFSFSGRRRGWILTCQLFIMFIIIVMAHLSPNKSPILLASFALVLAILSASQDIVIDAHRVEVLTNQERGLGSALYIEGYRIAMLVSSGIGLMLADYLGWKTTYLIMSMFMILGIIGTFIADEEHFIPVQHDESAFKYAIASVKKFLTRDKAVYLLGLIILYKLSDVLSHSLTSVFLLELKFSLTAIGTINKIVSILATFFGVMLAGILMIKINLYRSLLFFGVLQGVTNCLYILLAIVGKDLYLAISVVFIENICSGMGTSALLAFLTGLCDKQHSATQFALLSSLTAIARIYVGSISGVLVNFLGWNYYYLVAAIMAIPSILLIICLKKQIIACDPRFRNSF